MVSPEIATLEPLLAEVVQVADSEVFLSGTDSRDSWTVEFGVYSLGCAVRPVSDYVASIDATEPDTPYVSLQNDVLSVVEAPYRALNSYAPQEFKRTVGGTIESISKAIDRNPRLASFAQQVSQSDSRIGDVTESRGYMGTSIAQQLAGVVYSRALTLSRRYAPTEMLLEAYRAGLFVFGWDWEEEVVLCLRPE